MHERRMQGRYRSGVFLIRIHLSPGKMRNDMKLKMLNAKPTHRLFHLKRRKPGGPLRGKMKKNNHLAICNAIGAARL
jgi:hypothetical protein